MNTEKLIYHLWDEELGDVKEVKLRVLVSKGVLFIRKLVNGTIIYNTLYEHISNESEEYENHNIYLKKWDPDTTVHGGLVQRVVLERCDAAPGNYEAEFFSVQNQEYELIETKLFEDSLDLGSLLLDHYLTLNGIHYEVMQAILDHDRHKVLFFLTMTDFQ